MPVQLTTKAQVNGYRFLLRRAEHAVIRRDARMLHDPMRSQWRALVMGVIIGLLLLAGCGIYGLISPQGGVGNHQIILGKESGGLYVFIESPTGVKRLHPVVNLASARLIVGQADSPKVLSEKKLRSFPRGPLVGILGAPVSLTVGGGHGWAICDSATEGGVITSVFGTDDTGETLTGKTLTERTDISAAIRTRVDGTEYLIYEGKRASFAALDPAVTRGLELDQVPLRVVSRAVFTTLTPVAPIRVPYFENRGKIGKFAPGGARIGSVIKTPNLSGSRDFYIVLSRGVQKISAPTAEILRRTDVLGGGAVSEVSAAELAGIPEVVVLPITDFPQRRLEFSTAAHAPVICVHWVNGAPVIITVGTDLPNPVSPLLVSQRPASGVVRRSPVLPVLLASADGIGDAIDAVSLVPGQGRFLQATGLEEGSSRRESLFYLADTGVKFGVENAKAAEILGFRSQPALVPWSIISLFPSGPVLAQRNARVQFDVPAVSLNDYSSLDTPK